MGTTWSYVLLVTEADGAWVAEFVDYPGFPATGATRAELQLALCQVLEERFTAKGNAIYASHQGWKPAAEPGTEEHDFYLEMA